MACSPRTEKKHRPLIVSVSLNELKQAGKTAADYKTLIAMDKNKDGFINQLDEENPIQFSNYEELILGYIRYLNEYRSYDFQYGRYLEKDVNGNGKIDSFEEQLQALKEEGKKREAIKLLEMRKESGAITPYQHDTMIYNLASYWGDYAKTREIARKISDNNPQTPFRGLFEKSGAFIKPVKESRYLYSQLNYHILAPTQMNQINYLAATQKELNRHYPLLFSDKNHMLRLTVRLLTEVEIKLMQLEEKKDQNKAEIEKLNRLYNDWDNFYALLAKQEGLPDYHGEIVSGYSRDMEESVYAFLKSFIEENQVPEAHYHFVISAFLKRIKNNKPVDEYDFLFSPDTLFKKEYGVCADQSPAFARLMEDLKVPARASIYLWERKSNAGHLSMIYQNGEKSFFIFDNYGTFPYSFSSRQQAIDYNCVASYRYRAASSVSKEPGSNQRWSNILSGKEDSITSRDKKIRLIFSEPKMCGE
jgi:hypothetical protein